MMQLKDYSETKHYKHSQYLKYFLLDYSNFNENIQQTKIKISFLGLNISSNNSIFGLQKIINNEKFFTIKKYLLEKKYKEKKENVKKSYFENKQRIQINTGDNEYYKIDTLEVKSIANLIFSDLHYQTIEPSQFPNVVKYTKYESIIFSKQNISIFFNSYSFKKEEEKKYNVEIIIKKYKGIHYSEILINELNEIIYLINN